MRVSSRLAQAFAAVLLTAISCISTAFEVSPMTSTINASTHNREIKLSIDNNEDKMTAIEVSVAKRDVDKDGTELLSETEDFYIYPPQLILKPYEKRTIKVKWIGEKTDGVEDAYRVIVEQLPIELEERTTSGITLLFKYETALYLDPGNTESKLSLSDFSLDDNHLILTLANEGTKHQTLNDYDLVLTGLYKNGEPFKTTLTGPGAKTFQTRNVLAKKQLKMPLPLPEPLVDLLSSIEKVVLQKSK